MMFSTSTETPSYVVIVTALPDENFCCRRYDIVDIFYRQYTYKNECNVVIQAQLYPSDTKTFLLKKRYFILFNLTVVLNGV